MLSTLTQTCLSIPQFGSCSSFGTFRPAFSHTGTIRPLSVILPASPTFNHSPGSNTPSPTSKVPSWKVCFHLQILLWVLFWDFVASLLLVFCCLHRFRIPWNNLTIIVLLLLIKLSFPMFPQKRCAKLHALLCSIHIYHASNQFISQINSFRVLLHNFQWNTGDALLQDGLIIQSAVAGLGQIEFLRTVVGQHPTA